MLFTSTLNHGCDAILICQSYPAVVAVWHVSCLLDTHLRSFACPSVKLSHNESAQCAQCETHMDGTYSCPAMEAESVSLARVDFIEASFARM